jgi:hypothetical protein
MATKIFCDMCGREISQNEQHGRCQINVRDPRIEGGQYSVEFVDLCEGCLDAIRTKQIGKKQPPINTRTFEQSTMNGQR